MKKFLLSCLLIPSLSLAASVEATDPNSGSKIVLYDVAGVCVGDARKAEYISKKQEKVLGCWVTNGTSVFIVFFDGDTATIPVHVFIKSKDT